MSILLPTRVSIYDFLIEDTQPIDSIVANTGRISTSQARILIEGGIQAIVSALLAYNQSKGSDAVLAKLLNRSQVKHLRKYNAFNLVTMNAALEYSSSMTSLLFSNRSTIDAIHKQLSIDAKVLEDKVKPVLSSLTLICLREIAILADFAKLDANDVQIWLLNQNQFLIRSNHQNDSSSQLDNLVHPYIVPKFNMSWHRITGYKATADINQPLRSSIPRYANVIGLSPRHKRTQENPSETSTVVLPTSKDAHTTDTIISDHAADADADLTHDEKHTDVIAFSALEGIVLPNHRWLLQLAKVADIYLCRNRLKISPEPEQATVSQLIKFDFIDGYSVESANESSSLTSKQNFIWKNPVLIVLFIVVITLTVIAFGKSQYKSHNSAQALNPSTGLCLVKKFKKVTNVNCPV